MTATNPVIEARSVPGMKASNYIGSRAPQLPTHCCDRLAYPMAIGQPTDHLAIGSFH
ncbi:hypothetical protein [Allorhizocola rhizosphaerae]|uniref:hypothetical protein n=1 Tax=Allorhizocola rhizosphaerae TaxID=1872709 RepID=UPI0013C2FDA2|nr:hypothetical protein [Allorhizocola rhizosphaerae]